MTSRALTKPRAGRDLVEVLQSLPPGNYRAILTVTKIRKRGGYEVAAETVVQQAADVRIRRRRRKEIPA